MDGKQLSVLKVQLEAILRLKELMESSTHCTINENRHSLSTVKFNEPTGRSVEVSLIHNKEGLFEIRCGYGPLTLSDKSKTALEAMSSVMAITVKSVLNDELVEIQKAFSMIEIDGQETS